MKSIWIGLFVTLLLVGHVQASEGGGGDGGKMSNPFHKDPWGDMFADFDKQTPEGLLDEFDGPSENLEQALYKVKYNGKYLTEDQRKRYFEALNNYLTFEQLAVEKGGLDAALEVIVKVNAGTQREKSAFGIRATTILLLKRGLN